MLSDSDRSLWRERTAGQPGPQRGREESVSFQEFDGAEEVVIYTTRPATVADLLDTGRSIIGIVLRGDTYQIRLPGSEYRMGGILGALRRRVEMSDEQRAAAGARMRAIHAAREGAE